MHDDIGGRERLPSLNLVMRGKVLHANNGNQRPTTSGLVMHPGYVLRIILRSLDLGNTRGRCYEGIS
jgi:hypothetical protein